MWLINVGDIRRALYYTFFTSSRHVSIFFTRLWSVGTAFNLNAQNLDNFQDSQLRMRINTKPNGKQKRSEDLVD